MDMTSSYFICFPFFDYLRHTHTRFHNKKHNDFSVSLILNFFFVLHGPCTLYISFRFSTNKQALLDSKAAEPIIEEGLKVAPEDSVFIYCSVGDRT
ncbi:UNVERIFIED_CONTAM: hypothetical protein NCL1_10815 [Trichonephila clavipes]